MLADPRPDAPLGNIVWAGDAEQSGQYLHGYGSAWLPESLLDVARRNDLVDAIFEASRVWGFALHFNKGLAGAPADALAATRDTATNPAVLKAFALLITGSGEGPAFPGIAGHEPHMQIARREAAANARVMKIFGKLVPDAGSYVSESDFFLEDWQRAFWGANYPRLLAAKRRYDPDGLFTVHHGVGSEAWSADGFSRTH